jgi:hypothetical protein
MQVSITATMAYTALLQQFASAFPNNLTATYVARFQ